MNIVKSPLPYYSVVHHWQDDGKYYLKSLCSLTIQRPRLDAQLTKYIKLRKQELRECKTCARYAR